MKKKVLVTRKLLRSNEERASKLWDAKLNLNDEVYSQQKIIELSQGCDGILSSLTEKIDEKFLLASRNIPNIDVLPSQGLNVYNILRRDYLFISEDALNFINERFKDG